jgi:hypothetical protein
MIAATDIERARAVRIEDEIARRGIQLKRASAELVGPCPVCGGDDRFAIHTKKQLWNCRKCEVGGNDAISLVRHLDGCDFVSAITTLTGDGARIRTTPPPKLTKRHDDEDDKASKATWLWSPKSSDGPREPGLFFLLARTEKSLIGPPRLEAGKLAALATQARQQFLDVHAGLDLGVKDSVGVASGAGRHGGFDLAEAFADGGRGFDQCGACAIDIDGHDLSSR